MDYGETNDKISPSVLEVHNEKERLKIREGDSYPLLLLNLLVCPFLPFFCFLFFSCRKNRQIEEARLLVQIRGVLVVGVSLLVSVCLSVFLSVCLIDQEDKLRTDKQVDKQVSKLANQADKQLDKLGDCLGFDARWFANRWGLGRSLREWPSLTD